MWPTICNRSCKRRDRPIKNQSNYRQLSQKAGNFARLVSDCFDLAPQASTVLKPITKRNNHYRQKSLTEKSRSAMECGQSVFGNI